MPFPKKDREEAKERGKVDPAIALYFPPKLIGPKEGSHCSACMMFVEGGKCTVVEGEIDGEHGICGLYVLGEGNHGAEDAEMAMTPKKIAGYVLDGPTHCGNCEYYGGGENASGPCQKVRGTVEFHACCNFWESED